MHAPTFFGQDHRRSGLSQRNSVTASKSDSEDRQQLFHFCAVLGLASEIFRFWSMIDAPSGWQSDRAAEHLEVSRVLTRPASAQMESGI
jgi:hypothetical protein